MVAAVRSAETLGLMEMPHTMKDRTNSKIKNLGVRALRVVIAVIAWCCMMALYFATYDLIEQRTVPVSLPSKIFMDQSWTSGYFKASGAFENQSAVSPDDELLPQANSVTCSKQTSTCTVATADIFDRFLDVDVSEFDISSWTDQQIIFADDSPICVTNSYVIDRASQTVTLLIRKRATIADYAAKSKLHPCDNIKDANVDLADGFEVHWRAKTAFKAKNGLYFHIALIAMNGFFFAWIFRLWHRRKGTAANQAAELEPKVP